MVICFLEDKMVCDGVIVDFVLGGIIVSMVVLYEKGLIKKLIDV